MPGFGEEGDKKGKRDGDALPDATRKSRRNRDDDEEVIVTITFCSGTESLV